MKKIVLPALLIIAAACQTDKKHNDTVTDSTVEKHAEMDKQAVGAGTVRLADSVQAGTNVTAVFDKTLLVFTGLPSQVLDSLYRPADYEGVTISDYSRAGMLTAMKTMRDKFYSGVRTTAGNYKVPAKQTWDNREVMKIADTAHGYVQVRYDGSGYTGGAHGYAFINYRVVDTKGQKVLRLDDIMDVKGLDWNTLVRKYAGKRSTGFFDEKIKYTNNFWLDNNNLHLVYGQYEIAAYAEGIIDVAIPYNAIGGQLKPDFKTRMGL